jgi:ribosome biogenesis GTPase
MSQTYRGIVTKTTGSLYSVRMPNGEIISCKLKGNFRIKGIKTTNPIAVGDDVNFIKEEKEAYGLIIAIEERKNYIARKSINLSRITHLLAANIDKLYLIISLYEPRTPLGFIDRFLTAAESFRINTTLLFNKIDIYDKPALQALTQMQKMYRNIGYPCLSISASKKQGLDALKEDMLRKVCLFGGQSGVGKSTIINALDNTLQLKIGDISSYHNKGKHTTTFAEMFELSFGSFIIDTPGIKEFGLIDYEKEEVTHYFPEMLKLLPQCKFKNCTHTHEPQCAVKKAVEKGEIAMSRYHNYISIIENEDIDLKNWMLR